MARLSQRAGKNRLAVAAGIGVVPGVAWLLFAPHGVEQVGEERVNATVVQMILGPDDHNAKPGGVAIVLVELPEGGRARVFAPGTHALVGSAIAVTVKRFSDDSREVTGAGGDIP
jgi:hypothetical protein